MTWAIYKRVSTDEQEESGTSLDSQEERCRAYLVKRGYNGDVRVYSDTWTGSQLRERPALTELRRDMRRGQIEGVVCYAVDRLTRGGQAHLFILLEEFKECGVLLEFVSETFDDTPTGRFMLSVMGFMAEVEREKIHERTSRGVAERVRSGRSLHGTRTPYGYLPAPEDRMIEEPDEAPIVRRMFRELESGYSLRHICDGLTADGIPTHRGGQWRLNTVRQILKNPLYAGAPLALRYKSRPTASGKRSMVERSADETIPLSPDLAPALVSSATFTAVQRQITQNKHLRLRQDAHRTEGLLRGGLLRCGVCGRTMSYSFQRRPNRPNDTQLYVCDRRDGACQQSVVVREVDRAAWDVTRAILTRPDVVRQEVERLRADDPTERELAFVARGLEKVETQIKKLARIVAQTDDDMISDLYAGQLQTLADQRKRLLAERTTLTERQSAWATVDAVPPSIEAWCERVGGNADDLDNEDKRSALLFLGVTATVWPKGRERRITVEATLGACVATEATQSSCGLGQSRSLHLRWTDAEIAALAPEMPAYAAAD